MPTRYDWYVNTLFHEMAIESRNNLVLNSIFQMLK